MKKKKFLTICLVSLLVSNHGLVVAIADNQKENSMGERTEDINSETNSPQLNRSYIPENILNDVPFEETDFSEEPEKETSVEEISDSNSSEESGMTTDQGTTPSASIEEEIQESTIDEKIEEEGSSDFSDGLHWGSASYTFDSTSGVLSIGSGEINNYEQPWMQDVPHTEVKKIVFTGPVSIGADASNLFSVVSNVSEIDGLQFLDTSNVTNMSSMFYDLPYVTELDVSNFDTSQVTNMSNMFSGARGLINLNLSNFDTSQVVDMSNMFYLAWMIQTLDVSQFDTSQVLTFKNMFYGLSSLKVLDVSGFDTANVQSMNSMFYACMMLEKIDLSNFDTTRVTDMEGMFSGAKNIQYLVLGDEFRFTDVAGLEASGEIDGRENTGKWTCSDGSTAAYEPAAFMASFGTGELTGGTYTGEEVPEEGTYWGSAPYTFDEETGTLTVGKGDLDNRTQPWKQGIHPEDVIKIIFTDQVKLIGSGRLLFGASNLSFGLSKLKAIDGLDNLDLNNTTDLYGMFIYCEVLDDLDLSSFNTVSVRDMSSMFSGCRGLTNLDVTGFDTSSVTNMSRMFSNCYKLTSLDVTGFDTSSVTNMSGMFSGCTGLTSLDLSSFDTSSVTTMANMFTGCRSLINLNLRNFDTNSVTSMFSMFSGCTGLTSLNLSSFDTSSVTTMASMFFRVSSIENLDVSSFDTSKVLSMESMFRECLALTNLDVSRFNTSSVTTMANMFSRCQRLTSLNVTGFDTSSVTNMSSMFYLCMGLTDLDVSSFDTSRVTTMESMFERCSSLLSLDLITFDTSSVTIMSNMFNWCSSLTNLDLSNFNTSSVVTMSGMFESCSRLTVVDVSSFDTSSVKSMARMFSTTRLKTVDVSNFDTSNVNNMSYMFGHVLGSVTGWEVLDLSNFDTSSVTTMEAMFSGCRGELDLSSFDTSNVTTMKNMFYNGGGFLDISSFDTESVRDMSDMFSDQMSGTGVISKFKSLTLGEKFRFIGSVGLLAAPEINGPVTGKWTREDGSSLAYTPEDFTSTYGEGDLTPGTYIGERSVADLETNITFDNQVGIVGQSLKAEMTILQTEESASNAVAKDISVNINKFLDSNFGSQQSFEFDKEVTLEIYNRNNDSLISSEQKLITDHSISLPDLNRNRYFKIIISGVVWNTSKRTDEGNYDIQTDYSPFPDVDKKSHHTTGFYQVESGMFGLSNVPSQLLFKDTLFSQLIKDKKVNRVDPSWKLEVKDYRGTIGIEEGISGDRDDWEIVATAKPFVNQDGKTIGQDVLGITYTQNGQTSELSADAESLLISHSTDGELPINHHRSTYTWDEKEGFHAKVYNSKGIEPGDTLQSEITIELRSAP